MGQSQPGATSVGGAAALNSNATFGNLANEANAQQ